MTTSFSVRRTDPYSPPAEHRRLQSEEPVAHIAWPDRGGEVWTIAKHEDVRAVLGDPRFSSDRSNPSHPAHMAYNPGTHAGALIEMDPPEHAQVRGRVMNEFTVRKVAAMRPRVEEIVGETIDAMLASGSSGDLVELLSLPVPSTVIAELLGVPYEDHPFFQKNSAAFTEYNATSEEKGAAIAALRAYIASLVDARIEAPGDDILSRQLASGASRDEAVGLGFLLLIAGHETTANMISLSIMTLLDKPELLAQLRENPTLIPGAVEELLRYFTIAGESGGLRLATADIEVRGVTIPANSVVLALSTTANRDPEVFAEPDKIDFTRGARNHVAFGFGPHQCLGQNVARLELEVVLAEVIRRVPTLRLAGPKDSIPFKEYGPNYGIYALPVEW